MDTAGVDTYTTGGTGAGSGAGGGLFSKAGKAQAEDLNHGAGTRDGSVALRQSTLREIPQSLQNEK